jgi:hypothetical protein
VPAPIPKKISEMMPTFQNVAQTSHYLVRFGLPPASSSGSGSLRSFLRSRGVDDRFHLDDVGLLCSSAVLPGSTFANSVVTGEFQGVVETVPHTRNFTRISLEFYVDNQYKSMKFLEHWMEYITGGSSANPNDPAYRFQLNYPSSFKSNSTKIVKFEKNFRQYLEYNFINLFPIALNSTRVTYQNSQVLKATCAFSFERYICGERSSIAEATNTDRNKSEARFDRPFGFDPASVYNQDSLIDFSSTLSAESFKGLSADGNGFSNLLNADSYFAKDFSQSMYNATGGFTIGEGRF